MSWQPCNEQDCIQRSDDVELLIRSHEKDLGGFTVRRALPAEARQMVGPYIFFDHMGPAQFPNGEGVDVRPHPHIGISTVTWLFDGEIMHRDSLGYHQPIQPGAVNFMTAGRGIVHSERTSPEERERGAKLHGIQLWLALPTELQETAPAFTHYPAEMIPVAESLEPKITVIIGEAYGTRSPVETLSSTLYVEALFSEPSQIQLPDNYEERAVYLVEGELMIGDCKLEKGEMAVIRPGATASIRSGGPARAMLIGGESYPENRTIWWNFVSSWKERIEEAKRDWSEGRFDSVPGETEFIPLPK
jgi:redox-sensitive bicupin YhaK (pirin superfamily)